MFKSIKSLVGSATSIVESAVDITTELVGVVEDVADHATDGVKAIRKEIQEFSFEEEEEQNKKDLDKEWD